MTTQQAKAQRQIQAKGALYAYQAALKVFTPENPSMPWRVGQPLSAIAAGLNNVVNADLANNPAAAEAVASDTVNTPPAAVNVWLVFLDAKARGSSTQGMAAEYIERTDVIGGNKIALLAGGQGIIPQIGDQITGLIDGEQQTVAVSKLKVLAPNGVPILYTMEIEL